MSEITGGAGGAHLVFGEHGGFTGEWRLASANCCNAFDFWAVLGPPCKFV